MTARQMRRSRPTLAGHVAVLGTGAAAFWVVAVTVLFNTLVAARLGSEVDALVEARAQAAAATVRVTSGGDLTVLPGEDDALDVNVWIYQGDRLVEGVPGGLPGDLLPVLLDRREVLLDRDLPASTRYAAVPVPEEGQQVGTVVAAAPLLPYPDARRDILAASSALAALTLAGTYLVLRVAVQRAIAPVARMTEQAAGWSVADTGQRFGASTPYAELDTLGRNLDRMLERLSVLLRHEQRLTAELSHELRTPLATMRAELELLALRPRAPDEVLSAATTLIHSVDRLTSIVDTLLLAASREVDATQGVWPVSGIIADVVAALRRPGSGPAVDVSVEPEDLTVGAPPDIVERALSPVVDNALRFAHRHVTVTARPEGTTTVVSVANDGPVPPPGDLFQPGGVRAVQPGHRGAGLGLPLARRLARALGGDVVALPGPDGARFELRVPRGPS